MLNSDYKDILSEFLSAGVEFLVVGAYAVGAHGLPRATGDIDLFISPSAENAERVLQSLLRFGAPCSGWSVQELQKPNMVFQIGVEPCRIDILTSIGGVTFTEAWPRRLVLQTDGMQVPFLGLEDLITSKEAADRSPEFENGRRVLRGDTPLQDRPDLLR